MNQVDFVNPNESEPCVFSHLAGGRLVQRSLPQGNPQRNVLKFDAFNGDTEDWEPYTMALEKDGPTTGAIPTDKATGGAFFQKRTRTVSFGNCIDPDGHQGVQIFISTILTALKCIGL